MAGTTAPLALTDARIADYVDRGYLAIERLVGPDEVAELAADLLKLARGGYPCPGLDALPQGICDDEALGRILCIHQPHRVSPVIRRYCAHPLIAGVLRKIVAAHLAPGWWDGSVKCMQPMFFAKGPGKPGQAWHQDEVYIPTRDRSLAGAWIAIDDADVDNGCLWVLPGSHRSGVLYPQRDHGSSEFDSARESYGFNDSAEVPVAVPAGSVVFFNGYLLHRSKPNRSASCYRRALVNHYMSSASLLPWRATGDGTPVARADCRAVFQVAGEDPYAERGYENDIAEVHLRAEQR